MSYKQNSSRLRRLHDFFGITDSSGLIPLSRIWDNGVINNGKAAATEERKSVLEQLKDTAVAEPPHKSSRRPKERDLE